MQFEAKCNTYVKRDVLRMLVKTFSAAWLSTRNPLCFLGIVIVYPGDSRLCISLWVEGCSLSTRLFGAQTNFRIWPLKLIKQASLSRLIDPIAFSHHSRKYEHLSYKLFVNIFSSNMIANLLKIFQHPRSFYLETRRLSVMCVSSLICLQM